MNHHSRRKNIRGKSKRLAAAVAGAAIMSAGMLPGIPTAHAAPNYNNRNVQAANAGTTAAPTTVPDKDLAHKFNQLGERARDWGRDWQNRDRDWGRNWGRDWGRDRDCAYGDRNCATNDQNCAAGDQNCAAGNQNCAPGDQNCAAGNQNCAPGDQNCAVGDQNCVTGAGAACPTATIPGQTNINQPVAPPTVNEKQQMLYQTTSYDNWQWNESTYPQDMALGVLLQNPLQGGAAVPIPNDALGGINNIDFGRQLVIFAHLGTTAAQGYGIGIASIVQTGNDLTVTVRSESPQANQGATATKADDLVPIDRATLNFSNPIKVTFIDQNGTVLGSQNINPS